MVRKTKNIQRAAVLWAQNSFLMREVRGERADWFELTGILRYLKEPYIHTTTLQSYNLPNIEAEADGIQQQNCTSWRLETDSCQSLEL